MHHVLTIVSAPNALEDRAVRRVADQLQGRGGEVGPPAWRRARTAVDLDFAGVSCPEAESIVGRLESLAAGGVDCLAQETGRRDKALLVADLESTIIDNEMLDEMAAAIGVGEQVAAITSRAMRGELDFAASLEARLALFSGRSADLLDTVARSIRLNPGAEALVAGLRDAGVTTALVTGGFHDFADPIARRLGFDRVFANRLEIVDGTLTGRALPPILDRDAKRTTLLALCDELGIEPDRTVAIGDGANDLAMLATAGLGVAYRAKPAVREAAGARIDRTGLDTLLYFLGLPAA